MDRFRIEMKHRFGGPELPERATYIEIAASLVNAMQTALEKDVTEEDSQDNKDRLNFLKTEVST